MRFRRPNPPPPFAATVTIERDILTVPDTMRQAMIDFEFECVKRDLLADIQEARDESVQNHSHT